MDIGLQEIILISVIALVVLGPERLPGAIKTLAVWIARLRRSFNDIRHSIEQEINADEIRQQIHNENILHELGETRQALDDLEHQLQKDLLVDKDSPEDPVNAEEAPPGTSNKLPVDPAKTP